MFHTLKYIFQVASFIIAPPYCSFCKKWLPQRTIFCDDCDLTIVPIVSDYIKIRDLDIPILAISNYQEPIKHLILSKLWSNRINAIKLGHLIWEKTVLKHLDFDYIIPIPLHWTRFFKRGYNQAEVMANIISKNSKSRVLNVLKRSKRTTFQSLLSKHDRSKNIYNAFFTKNGNLLRDKKILIIDDLMTTGATIKSACLEISKFKPKEIKVVVACRVI